MKTRTLVYLIPSAALLVLSSCNKKPKAGFSISNKEPLIDEDVTFSNTSSGGVSYVWDFGDGTSSTEQSPKHAYDKEGVYEVTLTAYAKKDKSWSLFADQVNVQHPDALFTGKVDGDEMRLLSGVGSVTAGYGINESFSGGQRSVIYSAHIGDGSRQIGIELGTLTVDDTFTLAETSPEFHDMIRVKEYYFSTGASDGIRIYYEAPNGIIWSTDAGAADQSASNFIMTYNENRSSPDRERFKARFNCTLYDGLGNSMIITDGLFELDFANI